MSSPRHILGVIGIILLLAGMARESRVVVWIAIVLLGLSVALRIIVALRARFASDSEGEQD